MSTNIDFKNLWKQQDVEQPNMDDLLLKLKKFNNTGIMRIVAANALMITVSAGIILIWYYFQPKLISTKIGIVMVILAMLIFLLAYNKLYQFYKNTSDSKSNSDYLNDLIAIKRKQKFLQTTMMQLYFILLSIGLCLYLYEYTSFMTPFWTVMAYGITLAWILFNWIYIRPKTIKNQQVQIDTLIERFELINAQLNE